MHKFESLRVFFSKNDSRLARMFHLTEERAELDTPFVINKGFREKAAAVTAFEDPGTQVDILSITHRGATAQGLVNAFF